MVESVLEMATELVSAQIQAGSVAPENMSELLTTTHHQLLALQAREASGSQPGATQAVNRITDWRKSIGKHAVICMECGASFRQLSIRHLREHNLNKRSYQLKYGIPRTQSLAAKASTARRRAAVRESRPWEKTPKYIEAQASTVESKEKAVKTAKAPAKQKASAKKASAKKAKAK